MKGCTPAGVFLCGLFFYSWKGELMITVNGEKRTLENPVTVTEYLKACNYVPVQVVVELNEEIIKRETYDTTVLKDGDVVEILQFMGGGSC